MDERINAIETISKNINAWCELSEEQQNFAAEVFNFADSKIGDSGDHCYENVLNKMNEPVGDLHKDWRGFLKRRDVDFWEYFTQFYADTHGESVDDIRAKFSESETMEAAQIYGFLYEIKYAGDDARAYL